MLFKVMITNLEYTYEDTQKFWVGNSADKMRQAFKTRVVPKFEETRKVLTQINNKCIHWIKEALQFEASLAAQ
jgi:hypothetical protein